MPANHYIDEENKIIFTEWHGEPSDNDLVGALNIYLSDIKSKPELEGFNELVDFSNIRGLRLSIDVLIELGKIAAKFDKPGDSKLAIVVSSTLVYGFARMYGIYRNSNPQSTKKVFVFRSKTDAMTWLISKEEPKKNLSDFFVQKTDQGDT
jgi:hypothetical protein